jgi:hypothetical protein
MQRSVDVSLAYPQRPSLVLRFAECSSRPHSVALGEVSCSPPEDFRGFGLIGPGLVWKYHGLPRGHFS